MTIKNKKAMVFTLMAIALLSLFLVNYTIYSIVKDRKSIQRRIETMNTFVLSSEEDLPRHLYSSGFRMIFLMETEIADGGNFIVNPQDVFQELFYDGTFYGDEQSLMEGVTFSGIQDSLNGKASKLNVKINLSDANLTVDQIDPWNVRFNLTFSLLIEDKGNLALWNKTSEIIAYVPVNYFDDPVYFVETSGLVTNKINKTIYDVPVAIGNLENYNEGGYYTNNTLAPSFLKRLGGNLNPDENGIESLVYIPNLISQGITPEDKSCVDYIYFSSDNPSSHIVSGMPSWFKLDDAHDGLYGV